MIPKPKVLLAFLHLTDVLFMSSNLHTSARSSCQLALMPCGSAITAGCPWIASTFSGIVHSCPSSCAAATATSPGLLPRFPCAFAQELPVPMSIGTSPDTAAGFVDPSPQEIPPATIGIFGKQAKETTGNSQFLSLLSAKLLAQLSSWVFKSATAKASKSMTAIV